MKKVSRMKPIPLSRHEHKKPWPERFPRNTDSIGIEIVGTHKDGVYEAVSEKQNNSVKWLINELIETFNVSLSEIYRHPEISYKVDTEAGTARW